MMGVGGLSQLHVQKGKTKIGGFNNGMNRREFLMKILLLRIPSDYPTLERPEYD